jgi:hypothetical protein
MVVLIKMSSRGDDNYLVEVTGKKLLSEFEFLLSQKRLKKAMLTILSRGKNIRPIDPGELPYVYSEVILTDRHIHRDATQNGICRKIG